MNREKDIVGVILAGGKSRRMGTNKALLPYRGQPLIEHIAKVMQEVFERVIVVADEREAYQFLNLRVYPDIHKDCGPLGGIHAAFHHSDANALFVVSCDLPGLMPNLIEYILSVDAHAPAVVPAADEKVHPLCGLYRRKMLPQIEQAIQDGVLALRALLENVGAVTVPITPELPFYTKQLLSNVNSPDDFAAIERPLLKRSY